MLTMHWSGCPAGCGNHAAADIGLLGKNARINGEIVDAFDVFVGGRSGPNARPGMKILEACDFSLASDKLLYLTGDAHHYERRAVADSMHVIAGGGGAFVHGTRIARDSNAAPPQCVYPDRRTSLRLALGMPLRLALGTAGFLPLLVLRTFFVTRTARM